MKKDLCSITIAKALKALGFNEEVHHCYTPETRRLTRWSSYTPPLCFISAPTIDEAIDWLRKKYNVVIYDHVPPFVDPKDDKHRIMYAYDVKYCNRRDGWNGRVIISHAECCSYDIYAAKRMAIAKAIRWIKKNKKCSKKTKK